MTTEEIFAVALLPPLLRELHDLHPEIVIDVDRRALDLNVDPEELARRQGGWQPPAPRYTGGVLAKYAALVGSASQGAVTTGGRTQALLARR